MFSSSLLVERFEDSEADNVKFSVLFSSVVTLPEYVVCGEVFPSHNMSHISSISFFNGSLIEVDISLEVMLDNSVSVDLPELSDPAFVVEPPLESSVSTLVAMLLVSDELPETSVELVTFWDTVVLGAVPPLACEFSEKTISETLGDVCFLVDSVSPSHSSHVVKIASCVVEFPVLSDCTSGAKFQSYH